MVIRHLTQMYVKPICEQILSFVLKHWYRSHKKILELTHRNVGLATLRSFRTTQPSY